MLKATAVQLQVQKRQCMTFTKPSTALPRLIPGKRNRSSLETFQSTHVVSERVTPFSDVIAAEVSWTRR